MLTFKFTVTYCDALKSSDDQEYSCHMSDHHFIEFSKQFPSLLEASTFLSDALSVVPRSIGEIEEITICRM